MREKRYFLTLILFLYYIFSSCSNDCIDMDGNVYKTVKIGNQIWMAENLKTTRYRNGDSIPNIKNNSDWSNLTFGAYCDFDNTANRVYGKLYNWHAVSDNRNIAPKGWHVPTEVEWRTLASHLSTDAGSKLKETGVTHWKIPNAGATNESGFSAMPAGVRLGYDGAFVELGGVSNFWSCTQFGDTQYAWDFRVVYNNPGTHMANIDKRYGFTIRCVKD